MRNASQTHIHTQSNIPIGRVQLTDVQFVRVKQLQLEFYSM